MGDALLEKCPKCNNIFDSNNSGKELMVCEHCNYHLRMPAIKRLKLLCDVNSYFSLEAEGQYHNPINFPKYELSIKDTIKKTNLNSSVLTYIGKIDGENAVMTIFDSFFMMGSIGCTEGEKITEAIEYSTMNKFPIILVVSSAGSRLQEGIFSLMQMAKISAAIARHSKAGLLAISVLTDPVIGGASLNLAMLADIILSEPNVTIGLAGKRILEQTVSSSISSGYQTSESMLEHGFLDMIVPRNKLKSTLARLLLFHSRSGMSQSLNSGSLT